MKLLMFLLSAATTLLSGCAAYLPVSKVSRDPGQGSEIYGVRVIRETAHLLALEVDYRYDDALGGCVFVGATTSCSGASVCKDDPLGSWAYTPARLKPGRHRARVLISINLSAPDTYVSDELHIQLYEGGKGTFVGAQLAYEKHWMRIPTQPAWARNWCKLPPANKRRPDGCGKP